MILLNKIYILAIALFVLGIIVPGINVAQDLSACVIAQKEKNRGNLERALELYATCIQDGELKAGNKSVALSNRGNILLEQQHYNRAIADFDEAMALDPANSKPVNNRGMAYQFKGLYNAAIDDFERALEMNKDHLDAANNLAWVRATCPVTSLRNGEAALEISLAVNEKTNYLSATMLDTLAAAYAEAGDFDKAIGIQEKVIALSGESPNEESADRIALYRQGKPYRDLSGL
ncbi:MAG: tetratricopeptide repeat protein [Pseudomonadales bacterium]